MNSKTVAAYITYAPRGKDGYPLDLGSQEPMEATINFRVPTGASIGQVAAAAKAAGVPGYALRDLEWCEANAGGTPFVQRNGVYPNSHGVVAE